jgi:hypothetical protein
LGIFIGTSSLTITEFANTSSVIVNESFVIGYGVGGGIARTLGGSSVVDTVEDTIVGAIVELVWAYTGVIRRLSKSKRVIKA